MEGWRCFFEEGHHLATGLSIHLDTIDLRETTNTVSVQDSLDNEDLCWLKMGRPAVLEQSPGGLRCGVCDCAHLQELIFRSQDALYLGRASRGHRRDVVVAVEGVQLNSETQRVDGQELGSGRGLETRAEQEPRLSADASPWSTSAALRHLQ